MAKGLFRDVSDLLTCETIVMRFSDYLVNCTPRRLVAADWSPHFLTLYDWEDNIENEDVNSPSVANAKAANALNFLQGSYQGQRFRCRYCNKAFKSKFSIARHERTLHRAPNLTCKICQKSFPSKLILEEHVTQHAPFHCSHCTYNKLLFCLLLEQAHS